MLDSVEIVLNFCDGKSITLGREIQPDDKVELKSESEWDHVHTWDGKPRVFKTGSSVRIIMDIGIDEHVGTTE